MSSTTDVIVEEGNLVSPQASSTVETLEIRVVEPELEENKEEKDEIEEVIEEEIEEVIEEVEEVDVPEPSSEPLLSE